MIGMRDRLEAHRPHASFMRAHKGEPRNHVLDREHAAASR